MAVHRVAIIFDDQVRPDTTGVYCRSALEKLAELTYFRPNELSKVPRRGFDLYLNIDDGLEYRLPADLHPSAWWAIDTHLNLEWCVNRAKDFDFVFAAQRDGAEQMEQAGIASVSWLPLACDPEVHRKLEVDKQFDVCFVGHLFSGPRADLLDLIQRRFRNSFVGQRFFEEMARTYSASRTVFNRSIRNDINMRVFEALGCGSLLVTNDLADNGQDELFRDGVHLATYRDGEELIDKIRFYLDRETLREQIAAAGRAEVLGKDTYRHRMEKLLAEVEKRLSKKTIGAASDIRRPDLVDADGLPGDSFSPEAVEQGMLALVPESARSVLLLGPGAEELASSLKARQEVEVDAKVSEWEESQAIDDKPGQQTIPAGQLFELIALPRALEYARDPIELLLRASRRLQPGGRVVASVTNLRHHRRVRGLLEGHWDGQLGRAAESGSGPVRFFTRREIEKLFFRAGLAVRELRGVPGDGHAAWKENGRKGEVKMGGLRIGGIATEQAEEFYLAGYLVAAEPESASDYGLTSIVVVTHNQLAYTRRCLDSVRRFTDEPYELVLVDNGSTDGTPSYLHTVEGATVLANGENKGFPAAANQAVRAAKGAQIVLLNNDCIVTTGWLKRLLQALHSEPKIGLAGPCSNFVSGEQQIPVSYDDDLVGLDGFAWDWGKANDGARTDTDRLVGFCLMIRREMIDKIGLLDEQFGIGCFEDDDYCRRALRAGYRVVIAKDAFVHHFGGRTFVGAGVNFSALMQRNEELYRQKWKTLTNLSPRPARSARARQVAKVSDMRVLLIAHLDVLSARLDRIHYWRYIALARHPGVTLFGPGVDGYHPGMSVCEAVEAACSGAWPDVILHGGDLKESGVPLVTGLQDAEALTAIELLDSWARPERQTAFINSQRFDVGLLVVRHHEGFYRNNCPQTVFSWTPNAVDTSLFKDYRQPKEYDVLLYGAINPDVYPLRARLARLLANQSEIRFRHIAHPGYYPPKVDAEAGVLIGADLSREINKAWIGIATDGIYKFLVAKYLEIAASRAVVAGNMPDEGRPIFEGNFIELGMEQSDEAILATLRTHLADKKRMRAMAGAAYRKVVREHSTDAFANKLLNFLHQKVTERSQTTESPRESSPEPDLSGAPAKKPRFSVRVAPGGGLLLERSNPLISLCMIARDNARTIGASLESIRPWVDEMIVVDTGSKDETPQIARKLGAQVHHFTWCDDFSAARNESIKYARGQWIFWMDSDDTIDEANGRKLRHLVERRAHESLLGYVMQVHCPGAGEDAMADVTVVDHLKLFRNLPKLRFDGRIHEQVLPAISCAGGEVAFTDIYVTHSGYDHSPAGQKRKLERDLRILHLELKERPDHPFTLFNLGMTFTDVGRYDEAAEYLWRSIEHSGSGESHVRKAYSLLVHCEMQGGHAESAWETCRKGLRLFPKDAELQFRRGVVLDQLGRLPEAVEAYQELLNSNEERHFTSIDRATRGYKGRQNLAIVYQKLDELKKAEGEWRKVVEEMPSHREGWRGLGDVLLRQDERDKALALADQLVRDERLQVEGRMLRGRALAANGDIESAWREFDRAVEEDGRGLDALQALCQFLFEFVDPAEAQGAVEELIQRDPADGAAYHNLGTIYARKRQFKEAAHAYRDSLQRRPDSAPTYVCLGHALRDSGDPQGAIEAWNHALRLAPDNEEARKALHEARAMAPQGSEGRDAPERQPEEATYTIPLRDRSVEVRFLTRGPVDKAILRELWERDVYGVRDLVKSPSVIIDVGAHIGAFTIMAAEAWPKARVIACEADPENFDLLKRNLRGRRNVELVEAAIVGEEHAEVSFNKVLDKFQHNSGGGSCVREEPGSVRVSVPAMSALKLWQSYEIRNCDILKLDCEGSEAQILQALADAGYLQKVKLVVGEWHAISNCEEERIATQENLARILAPTHEVVFGETRSGREGRFTARAGPSTRRHKLQFQ